MGDASSGKTSRRVEVDLEVLRAMGLIHPNVPHTEIAEEFRRIKQPLFREEMPESRPGSEHSNLIMVTSAIAGEGKTFTAINLAMIIAMEKDRTALLVDSDVVKRGVSRIFGLEEEKGLTDLIREGETIVPDVLVRTNVPKLCVLPAGQQDPHYAELFASTTMRWLTEELSLRYPDRVVIFDAPPILATTATSTLADLVDKIVFVVVAGQTSQESIREAVQLLGSSKPIGIVLNKFRTIKRAKYLYEERRTS
ncbi:MAG: XrtA-associated tyrosine autokinase [Gammaproteobacteria bacterium]